MAVERKPKPSESAGSGVEYLLSTEAIRTRCARILDLALSGGTGFSVHPERLSAVAEYVADVTLQNYPDLRIPFHSRWSHFQAAGVDRLAELRAKMDQFGMSPGERTRSLLDLVVVSVLLDAGSGPGWKYFESKTGKYVDRSEGLAVASLHMFSRGLFSSDPNRPFQVTAQGLRNLRREVFNQGLQISTENPLAGDRGRFAILRALADALDSQSQYFGKPGRPGGLIDFFAGRKQIRATEILTAVQRGLGSIWPGRVSLEGLNLGDVWPYAPLGEGPDALIPFHKLSQWLTYSMIEPIEQAGIEVTDVNGLTGLAEYRNGGLFMDFGVISLREPALKDKSHAPSSELIIEWRALTLALLEQLAEEVRGKIGKTVQEFPLGKVLEGGTWHAGRKIASKLRPSGAPPLNIQSDGTVF